jgi:transketolase
MPRCEVVGVNAGHDWPAEGGDHHEVMARLGFDLPAVLSAASRLRAP